MGLVAAFIQSRSHEGIGAERVASKMEEPMNVLKLDSGPQHTTSKSMSSRDL